MTTIEAKFESWLSVAGKDFLKGLGFAEKYVIPVASLVALLFPGAAPAATGIVNSVQLIQTAVTEVEQKYAAANVPSSGPQKYADVLQIVAPVVTDALTKEGVKNVNQAYIGSIVNAVVAVLNAQPAPAGA
jgi:hypothetical protein